MCEIDLTIDCTVVEKAGIRAATVLGGIWNHVFQIKADILEESVTGADAVFPDFYPVSVSDLEVELPFWAEDHSLSTGSRANDIAYGVFDLYKSGFIRVKTSAGEDFQGETSIWYCLLEDGEFQVKVRGSE